MSNLPRTIFITGTDTGCGKTFISVALIAALQTTGLRVAAMKPVASGCVRTAAGLRNADALALLAQADVKLPYEVINPYAFEPPIAPHIAARQAGVQIDPGVIEQRLRQLQERADMVIVEGVGGWQVPLNERDSVATLAAGLAAPVLLVVGMRLGCINHALLSGQAVRASGCSLLGWVANSPHKPMPSEQENRAAIGSWLGMPCLAAVSHGGQEEAQRVLRDALSGLMSG